MPNRTDGASRHLPPRHLPPRHLPPRPPGPHRFRRRRRLGGQMTPEAHVEVEIRQQPPAAVRPRGSVGLAMDAVATGLVAETKDEVDHDEEWWPEVALRFVCQK